MENIFDNNDLYPGYKEPLKNHFKHYFDSLFICFSPFLKIDGTKYTSLSQAKIVSLEELQESNESFKKLKPNDDRVIYSNSNTDYPDIDAIINHATVVKWEYILEHAGFQNSKEISLALRTSIGGLCTDSEMKGLQKRLDLFTTQHSIFNPTEGRITPLSLQSIYSCLKALGKTTVVVTDEFFQDRKTVDITTITGKEFVSLVRGYMYYFPIDRSLLFTIEWDSFFFLIGGNKELLEKITSQFEFEGFFCDDETMHGWDSGV